MGSEYIITPGGSLASVTSAPTPRLVGNTIVIGEVVETYANAYQAKVAFGNLVDILKNNGNVASDLRVPQIFDVTRVDGSRTFNINTDTVLVHGINFVQAALGLLYIEDGTTAANMDSNGYRMTCTWISTSILQATFSSSGDGLLAAGSCLLYYRDANSANTNFLAATVDGSQNVTVPAPA